MATILGYRSSNSPRAILVMVTKDPDHVANSSLEGPKITQARLLSRQSGSGAEQKPSYFVSATKSHKGSPDTRFSSYPRHDVRIFSQAYYGLLLMFYPVQRAKLSLRRIQHPAQEPCHRGYSFDVVDDLPIRNLTEKYLNISFKGRRNFPTFKSIRNAVSAAAREKKQRRTRCDAVLVV